MLVYCLLDLSKAFDKMNHYAMYIKLMNRLIPVQVLKVLENWFSLCLSCVKWGSVKSYFYELETGVRQGGVLSPFLFGIFIDDLVKLVNKANIQLYSPFGRIKIKYKNSQTGHIIKKHTEHRHARTLVRSK